MAAANGTNETNNKNVFTEFIRARNALLLPMFSEFNRLMFSPISLIYTHAMARGFVEDEELKTQIMDIKMLEQLQSTDLERSFHQGMSDLQRALNTNEHVTKLSVQNKLFDKNGKSVPEKYLTFFNSFYGTLERHRKPVNVTHKDVNRWISEQSRGTITDFISESNFDKYMDYLLVNSVYFSGDWELNLVPSCKRLYDLRNTRLKHVITIGILSCGRFGVIVGYPETTEAFQELLEITKTKIYYIEFDEGKEPSPNEYALPIGVFQFDTCYQNLVLHKNAYDIVTDIRYVTQRVNLEITEKGITVAAVTVLSQSSPDINGLKQVPADTKPTVFMIYDTDENVVIFMASHLHL